MITIPSGSYKMINSLSFVIISITFNCLYKIHNIPKLDKDLIIINKHKHYFLIKLRQMIPYRNGKLHVPHTHE